MRHFSFTPAPAPAPEPHRVVVSLAKDAPGRCRVVLKDSPESKEDDDDGEEEIVASSREPMRETVRALRSFGAQPGEVLEVYREGREVPDITGSLDWFAPRARDTARPRPHPAGAT